METTLAGSIRAFRKERVLTQEPCPKGELSPIRTEAVERHTEEKG